MAYGVQNFENGKKLTAEQLNHMEDGIYANSTNMAYEKQNFVNGQKLTAEQLNHMEAGIYANSVNSDSGTVTLPTLTNPGSAGDLAQGKQLIDASGNIVTGTLGTVSNIQVTTDNTSVQHSGTSIYVTGKRSTRAILETGATLRMDVSADKFGNAQRSQVLEGATFTSSNGLNLTGTMKATGGSGDIPVVEQATPTITVSSSGLITASATQEAGQVAAGTKSATKQLTTQAAQTITPGTSDKTISSGRYLTGTQTIKGDSNLKAENIKSGVSIFGVAGSLAVSSGGGSSGGLVMKTGTTTSNVIDTGLSSIEFLVIQRLAPVTTVGLNQGVYMASSETIHCSVCSSYSVIAMNSYTTLSTPGTSYLVDGGTFTWIGSGNNKMASGETYYWYAFGTE